MQLGFLVCLRQFEAHPGIFIKPAYVLIANIAGWIFLPGKAKLLAQQQAQGVPITEQYVLVMRFCAGGLANLYSDWLAGKLPITLDELTDTACNVLGGVIPTLI